ncbi:MAG: lysophospholipid acyltransferase family protein [Gammaproteobacteria bacterium]
MDITTLLIIILIIFFLLWLWQASLRANVVDWGHGWINFLDGFLRLFIKYFHRFQYQPVPLPETGPALLAANHISGLDPLLVIAACKRPVRFLIAQEQYDRIGLNWVFKKVGCIPVQRGGRVEKAFRTALQALENGEVVALFPEGGIHTRRKPAKRLKGGIAKLAELSGVPVYPVTIDGILIEGLNVLALLMPNRARLTSYPELDCASLGDKECMARLTRLLVQSAK